MKIIGLIAVGLVVAGYAALVFCAWWASQIAARGKDGM